MNAFDSPAILDENKSSTFVWQNNTNSTINKFGDPGTYFYVRNDGVVVAELIVYPVRFREKFNLITVRFCQDPWFWDVDTSSKFIRFIDIDAAVEFVEEKFNMAE